MKTKTIKASCGGQGCSIQPYVLPYCGGDKPKFANKHA